MTKTEQNAPAYWSLANQQELDENSPTRTKHWLEQLTMWENDISKIRASFESFAKNVSDSLDKANFLANFAEVSTACFTLNCLGHEVRFQLGFAGTNTGVVGEVVSSYKSGEDWVEIRSLKFYEDGKLKTPDRHLIGDNLEIGKSESCLEIIAYLFAPKQS